jgi:hypothetical protein
MLQAGMLWVRAPMRSLNLFQFTLSFQPQYGPGVDSVSNRNENKKIFMWGRTHPARKAHNRSPPFANRLSRKCGSLDI